MVSLVLALGGACGANPPEAGSTGCATAKAAAADTANAAMDVIAIAARDDRFDPACVSVDAPGRVQLVVRNEGRHPHNLTVDESRRVAVDAGQVALLDIDVPADGLRFVCTIHGGMDGEVRVRE